MYNDEYLGKPLGEYLLAARDGTLRGHRGVGASRRRGRDGGDAGGDAAEAEADATRGEDDLKRREVR